MGPRASHRESPLTNFMAALHLLQLIARKTVGQSEVAQPLHGRNRKVSFRWSAGRIDVAYGVRVVEGDLNEAARAADAARA